MACPACGCKTTYQFNHDGLGQDDERLERCACCGEVFDIEDHTPEDDDEHGDPQQTPAIESSHDRLR